MQSQVLNTTSDIVRADGCELCKARSTAMGGGEDERNRLTNQGRTSYIGQRGESFWEFKHGAFVWDGGCAGYL